MKLRVKNHNYYCSYDCTAFNIEALSNNMKAFKLILLSITLFLLAACSSDKSPSEVYEEYNAKVVQGINFVDDKAYYTKRKLKEVESKFPQYMKSMKKSREEVIEFYIDFSKKLAECKEIKLVKEVVENNTATLEYSQKDICGNESSSKEKQTIRMIKEGGWKIDDVLISI